MKIEHIGLIVKYPIDMGEMVCREPGIQDAALYW